MASAAIAPLKVVGTKAASLPVLICAKYAGVKVIYEEQQQGVVVPPFAQPSTVVVEAGQGRTVSGVVPCLRYLARMNESMRLEGVSEFASGLVDGWMEFAERELDFPANFNSKTASNEGRELISSLVQSLEDHLISTTYLVGHGVTVADIYVALKLKAIIFDEQKLKKDSPCMARWLDTCLNQPAFKEVIGAQGGSAKKAGKEDKGKKAAKKDQGKKQEGGKKDNKGKEAGGKKSKTAEAAPAAAAPTKRKAVAPKGPVTAPPKLVHTLAGRRELAEPALLAAALAGFELRFEEAPLADRLPSQRLALRAPGGAGGGGGGGGREVATGARGALRYVQEACPAAGLGGGVAASSSSPGSGGGDPLFAEAQVDAWVEFALNALPEVGQLAAGPALVAQARRALAALDRHLAARTFLCGARPTAAEAAAAPRAARLLAALGGPLAAACRWANTCAHLPAFAAVLGAPAVLAPGPERAPAAAAAAAPGAAGGGGGGCARVEGTEGNPALERCLALGLPQTTWAHPAAHSVEEQSAAVGHLEGLLTKNLVLADKKHGTFVVTVAHTRDVHTGVLGKLLRLEGKSNLRFAKDEVLEGQLGVRSGSVSPLCMMNAPPGIKFAVDKALVEADLVNCHPLRNDRTTTMKSKDLLEFVKQSGHEVLILDYDAAPPPPKPQEKGKKVPKQGKGEKPQKKGKEKKAPKEGAKDGEKKKETLLGISHSKADAFSDWYTQVITYAEMIDYSDISGCYVLRPWSFSIWETIQAFFDGEIKKLGVQNAYFPLFVSKSALETEKDHVEGFAPEVAWVTKSGDTDLAEPIAIRPTSETIMYPFFSNWIRSHRDLPLLLNQWSNVVRWEFKYPTPFLRSREFLWQEGHTAHASYEEANEMVMQALELYRRVYEELLACPVVPGKKTEDEKFAGGLITTTVEAFIHGSGRAIQGATSHHLGQNFAKMFDIQFEDAQGKKALAWQTSWGLTTRTIGVMVMVHGDDTGLVLPPRVAPVQAVVIPIPNSKCKQEELRPYYEKVAADLEAAGVRVRIDDRQNYRAGWKYNHWEQKGVPVRVEVGPRDMEQGTARLCLRHDGSKRDAAAADLPALLPALLEEIQAAMFAKAKAARDASLVQVTEWKDFVPALNRGNLVLTPFVDAGDWEDKVKEMSRAEALAGEAEDARTATSVAAKTLCIPFDQPPLAAGQPCFVSGEPAKHWVLWGRSY